MVLPIMSVRSQFYSLALLWFATLSAITSLPVLASPTYSNNVPPLIISNTSIEDGLSNSRGETLTQDDYGFIWIGTYDGLNRWDGYEFIVHKKGEGDSTLSNSTILDLFKDDEGMLWIGTSGGGLNKFDPARGEFTRYLHDPENSNSLSGNAVFQNSIAQDSTGNLWIGTKTQGLNQLDLSTGKFTHYRHDTGNPNSLSSNNIRGVYFDDETRKLWVGTTDKGLNQLDPSTGKFVRFSHDANNPGSISGTDITSILRGKPGHIWVTTRRGGLNSIDTATAKVTRYTIYPDDPDSEKINDMNIAFQDSKGILWMGTNGGGLVRFDPALNQFSRYVKNSGSPSDSLGSDFIRSIIEDESGLLYVGNSGGGFSIVNPRPLKFTHYKPESGNPNSLSDGFVLSVFEDSRGDLWIGNDRVLNRYNRKTGQFSFYRNDPADPDSISIGSVMATLEDKNGILWFATHFGGLNRFDPETDKFRAYRHDPDDPQSIGHDVVLSMIEDDSGKIWLGTRFAALSRVDPETETFTNYPHEPDNTNSPSDIDIHALHIDSGGLLWIGTRDGGLNRFDPETETFKRYPHGQTSAMGTPGSFVSSIYEDPQGNLWVGNSGGLSRLDRETDQFTHFTETDGLTNNRVQGILGDDQGNLWISTNNGLSKFNPKTQTFRNFDVSDGLQSNEFHRFGVYFRSSAGEMFFGGINGLNAFFPEQVKDNPYIPPVMLTDFKLFHDTVSPGRDSVLEKPIHVSSEIELDYGQNVFTLSFSALDFTSPKKNQYQYKLQGFDDDWTYINSDHRRATYTNLNPGQYRFMVNGSNSDGIWNEEGTVLDIKITPPFWLTPWFRILGLLTLLLVIVSLFAWQQRVSRQRQKDLKQKVAERTRELNEANEQLRASNEESKRVLKELERTNEDQKAFSYSVSHDLRAPLRAINGFSNALLEDYSDHLDETANDYLNRIENASNKMSELINGLLRLSRLSRQEFNQAPVNLSELAQGILETFTDRYTRTGAEVIIQANLMADGDKNLLQVALTNLLTNAWKFTRNTNPSKIEFGSLLQDDKIVFFIRDNGAGFEEKHADNLFKEFTRLHNEKAFEGIGIGLATVKRIINRHGGEIWAEGKVDQGAVFYFTLPNHIAQDDQ